MTYKKLFWGTFALLVIVLLSILYLVIRTNNDNVVPPYDVNVSTEVVSLRDKLTGVSASDLIAQFPYDQYIRSANIKRIDLLEKDLLVLDSLYPGEPSRNQRLLSIVLTDSMLSRVKEQFETFQPDSLLLLLYWTESFKNYAECSPQKAILYNSIYGFWGSFISSKLSLYTQKSSKIKYDFKYRLLQARCAQNRFTVAPKVSSFEKVIYNFLGLHWSHLIDASWNQASATQIGFLLFLMVLTIAGYYCLFANLYHYIKKKK